MIRSMKNPKPNHFKTLLAFFACFFMATWQPVFCQVEITPSTLNATGGTASGPVSLEWSIGEMTTVSWTIGGQYQVSGGILQGGPGGGFTRQAVVPPVVFPNPVGDYAYLQYKEPLRGNLHCELADAAGRIIRKFSFTHAGGSQVYKINMANTASGVLYLIVRFTATSNTISARNNLIKLLRR
jgi:hypothetical protein